VRLAVVGGKLQGTEACYLGRKAGFDTVLIDRRLEPPAAGLASEFHAFDVTTDEGRAREILASCDAVLPACEDDATLGWLARAVPDLGVPLLFDLAAYRVTSSKAASNDLIRELGVPAPLRWPACGLPAVVKPSGASGSEGVRVVADKSTLEEARAALLRAGHDVVVEEFVAGPSLSIEVLSFEGHAVPCLVTGLEFDDAFDCKRVTAPVDGDPFYGGVGEEALASLDASGARLSEALQLSGIMDVEVMIASREATTCGSLGGEAKVIEIDARLPSQTPTAVLHAYDANLLEMLVAALTAGAVPEPNRHPLRGVVYEHVRAERGTLQVVGEHVMGSARPLRLAKGFFGADEAMTDFTTGGTTWQATLIVRGGDIVEARRRAHEVEVCIAEQCHLRLLPEVDPHGVRLAAKTTG
jgi:pyrrolysine biosynthesis protein PylC